MALNLIYIGPHGVSPLVSGKLSQIPSFPLPTPPYCIFCLQFSPHLDVAFTSVANHLLM